LNVWLVETTTKGENNKRLGLASKLVGATLKRISTQSVNRLARQTGMSLLSIVDKAQHRKIVRPFIEQLIKTYEPPDVIISSGSKANSLMIPVSAKLFTDSFWVNIGKPRRFHDLANLILQQAWEQTTAANDSRNVCYIKGIPHHVTADCLAIQRAATACHFESFGDRRKILILLGGVLSGGAKTNFYDLFFFEQLQTVLFSLSDNLHTVFIANSRRTPKQFWNKLKTEMSCPNVICIDHDVSGAFNYLNLLANADTILVCADSMSMLWEASATNKPVFALVPWLGRGPTPEPQARNLDILLKEGRVKRADQLTDQQEEASNCPIDLSAEFATVTLEHLNRWRSSRQTVETFSQEPKSQLIF
jgi:mitochondrial fission protein ELM1